jgi:hypothetical protein
MKPAHLCRNLRTKKMYVPALEHEAFVPDDTEAGHTSHCWCNCTMSESGPDDRPVGTAVCQKERPCFEE